MITLIIGMCVTWADPVSGQEFRGKVAYIEPAIVWVLPALSSFWYAKLPPRALKECPT